MDFVDQHRRHRRQPAAERDRVGADPARGRPAQPRQRRRPGYSSGDPFCAALRAGLIADADAPANYTGVQDFDDYIEGGAPQFYDPDAPSGRVRRLARATRADGPRPAAVRGRRPRRPLLRRASATTTRSCRATPPRTRAYEDGRDRLREADVAGRHRPGQPPGGARRRLDTRPTCAIVAARATRPSSGSCRPTRSASSSPRSSTRTSSAPGAQADGHGFGFVDPAEEAASAGAAGYYSWSPKPGVRFIALDTRLRGRRDRPLGRRQHRRPAVPVARGPSSRRRRAADELVVLFSHHAIPSLTADVPDELRRPCTGADSHGHDDNPGCDLDPRDSTPIHLGADMEELLPEYPHVIAWVAGHSHVNSDRAAPEPGRAAASGASASPPRPTGRSRPACSSSSTTTTARSRSSARSSTTPAPRPPRPPARPRRASATPTSPRSAARSPPTTRRAAIGTGEGDADDRNVELLVADPRPGPVRTRPSSLPRT